MTKHSPRLAVALALVLLALSVALRMPAQESPDAQPSPPAAPRKVRISFLPPPLEGTVSLGIYDSKGTLLRVLHRESDLDEFQIGHDALSTTWDGNNDNGEPLPTGKYRARGYVVGNLPIEGVGFYFNDWVSADHPERIEKICAIAAKDDGIIVSARLAYAGLTTLICSATGDVIAGDEPATPIECKDATADRLATESPGKDGTRWVIEASRDDNARTEVKQYSAGNELLRSLTVAADEPQPRAIAASQQADRIFLLEENAAEQRLRSLSLLTTKSACEQSISDWTVDFEKKTTVHNDFRIENGEAVVRGGEVPPETVPIKLRPNPLEKDRRATVALAAGHDDAGSFLKTADGLPLQTISETQHLVRAAIAPHDVKSIDVFQDDGTVVEQFRVVNVDAMMAFDCGDFELK